MALPQSGPSGVGLTVPSAPRCRRSCGCGGLLPLGRAASSVPSCFISTIFLSSLVKSQWMSDVVIISYYDRFLLAVCFGNWGLGKWVPTLTTHGATLPESLDDCRLPVASKGCTRSVILRPACTSRSPGVFRNTPAGSAGLQARWVDGRSATWAQWVCASLHKAGCISRGTGHSPALICSHPVKGRMLEQPARRVQSLTPRESS